MNLPAPTKENSVKVLSSAKLTGWKLGNTKVFLKYFHADSLNSMVEDLSRKALMIQTWLRVG